MTIAVRRAMIVIVTSQPPADHRSSAEKPSDLPGSATDETLPPRVDSPPPARDQDTIARRPAAVEDATLPPARSQGADGQTAALQSSGRTFGDYELLEEIARGGMGVVYKARQRSLNRVVALKMILAGQLAAKEDVQRFYAEAEAAANLDHPGIVPIFEVGQHEDQHYFSMAFVDGGSLATKLNDGPLPPQAAAEYLEKVSRAIAFAHERGVIHRDLKPGNVLLDRHGEPKVTDFGLAKKVKGGSELTTTGQIIGTPSYMPPEQAAGKVAEIMESADVYSLGAILYALITGRPPFQAVSPLDTLMQVLEREPVPPRQLNPKLPADLETICLKCLEKAPARRYSSAQALADELGRYLRGEPIFARPITSLERGWRWCRRKPVIAGMAAAIVLVSVTGLAGILWQWRSAVVARNSARAANDTALDALAGSLYQQAIAARNSSEPSRRWTALDLLKSAEQLRGRAKAKVSVGADASLMPSLAQAKLPTKADLRSEAVAALLTDDARLVWQRGGSGSGLEQVGLSPSLQRGAVPLSRMWSKGSDRFVIALIDLATGKEIESAKSLQMYASTIALSADGNLVAFPAQKEVHLWDVQAGALSKALAFPAEFLNARKARTPIQFDPLEFTADGRHLIAFHHFQPSLVIVWDLESGAARTSAAHNNVAEVALSGSGQFLAHRMSETSIGLWDLRSGEKPLTVELPRPKVSHFALSHAGDLMAIVGGGEQGGNADILFWDPNAKQERWQIKFERPERINRLSFSPNGELLAAADRNGSILLLDLPTKTERFRLQAHRGAISRITWRPDSQRLWSKGADGHLKCWDLVDEPLIRKLKLPVIRTQCEVALHPQTNQVAAIMTPPDSVVRLFNRDTGQSEREFAINKPGLAPVQAVHGDRVLIRNDGQRIALISRRAIVLWDAKSGDEIARWQSSAAQNQAFSAAFNQEGQLLVAGLIVADKKSKLAVWKAETSEQMWESPEGVAVGCLSPDAKHIALWSALMTGPERTPPPTIVNLSTGQKVTLKDVEPLSAEEPVFSADGKWLASLCGPMRGLLVRAPGASSMTAEGRGAADSYVSLWNLPTGERKLQIRGSDSPMWLSFSASKSPLLAIGYRDGSVELWDPAQGALVVRWQDQSFPAFQVLWGQDGSEIVVREQPNANTGYGGFRLVDLAKVRRELAAIDLDW